MANEKIRIILIDDHSLVRDGIKSLLEGEEDLLVIDEAQDAITGIEKINNQKPDLAIVDIRMPKMSGIEAVAKVTKMDIPTKCLILSMHDAEEYVLQSIKAGAKGYLLKDASRDEFLKAIRAVNSGEKYFSGDISHIVVNKYLETLHGGPAPEPDTKIPEVQLTKREKQILEFVLNGFSNKEIAEQLGKSVRTIETHRFNLMKKMDAKNIMDLSQKAQLLNLN